MVNLGIEPKHRGNAMSEMRLTSGSLLADAQVIHFLDSQDYPALLKFIDAQYGVKFVLERTGASFEDCIDWCAQNAGGIDHARQVVYLLFDRYYLHLPRSVQAEFLYLAEEVGYDPNPTNKLDELKAICRAQINRGAVKAATLTQGVRVLLDVINRVCYLPAQKKGRHMKSLRGWVSVFNDLLVRPYPRAAAEPPYADEGFPTPRWRQTG